MGCFQTWLDTASKRMPSAHLGFLQLLALVQGVFSEDGCSVEAYMGGWGPWGWLGLPWIQRQLLRQLLL